MSRVEVLSLSLMCALASGACQIDDLYVYPDGGDGLRAIADAGSRDAGSTGRPIRSGADVLALLEGKTLLMNAAAVPTHPNGYDENINFGSASQCIHSVRMDVASGGFTVTTELATLMGAPSAGDRGTCDRATAAGSNVVFNTTAVLVENVRDNGGCFDLTLTYAGFGQEGRGRLSADQKSVSLELYFRDQAVGHRCGDGEVGAASVTLNQEPFTGNAVQVYTLSN